MTATHLADALTAAVPLHIRLMRDWTPHQRAEEARWLANARYLAERGDLLLYGGGRPGETAAVFNAFAKSLAALAYQPGGITLGTLGLHWCTAEHIECPGRPVPLGAS
jgi:hypothetical protein